MLPYLCGMIYTKNNLLLFVSFFALCGLCIFLGSVGGSNYGKEGLFVGALLGGTAGIWLTVYLALRLGWLQRYQAPAAFAGAAAGFVVASVVAVGNLSGPVVPVLSTLLIGIGGVAGKLMARQPQA